MPFRHETTGKLVSPGLFIVPSSFLQENIREVIIEDQANAFAWFNVSWYPRFKHNLTIFDPKLIFLGQPVNFNTRAIHIYGKKTEDQKSNTTDQKASQIIEIITGKEQLGDTRASDYSNILVAQNYTEAIASMFDPAFPRQRLLKGFPTKQPKIVISGENVTYEEGGKFSQSPNLTLFSKILETETILIEDKPIARSKILLDITLNIPRTQLQF